MPTERQTLDRLIGQAAHSVWMDELSRVVDHPRHAAVDTGSSADVTAVYYPSGGIPYDREYIHRQYGAAFGLTNRIAESTPEESAAQWLREAAARVTAAASGLRRAPAQIFHDIEPEDL